MVADTIVDVGGNGSGYAEAGFVVELDRFSGPLDLLLHRERQQLIHPLAGAEILDGAFECVKGGFDDVVRSRHVDRARRIAFADHELETWEFDVLSALRLLDTMALVNVETSDDGITCTGSRCSGGGNAGHCNTDRLPERSR